MEFIIYHNPRCSKSRQTLDLLRQNNIEPKVIEYLKTGLTKSELKEVFSKLSNPLKECIRTKESEFDKSINLENENQVIAAIVKTPKLLERPIVVKGKKAVIGRPPENILSLLK